VRNDVDAAGCDAVDRVQHVPAVLAHDDQPLRQGGDFVDDQPLRGVGRTQNRVQRRDDRHPERSQQEQQVIAGLAAEDAELMLQADQVHLIDVQVVRASQVGDGVRFGDLETHDRGVRVYLAGIVHRDDKCLHRGSGARQRVDQVGGEGGNPALTRQVIADDGYSLETTMRQ
jgi:hypothetical protein